MLYDEIRDAVGRQLEQSKALDTKSNFVFGSASLLIAGATALRNATVSSSTPGQRARSWRVFGFQVERTHVIDVTMFLALVAFAVVILCSLRGYWLRPFQMTPGPPIKAQQLVPEWALKPADDTKAMLTRSRLDHDLPVNETLLNDKIKWTRLALIALAAETGILAVMAALQLFS